MRFMLTATNPAGKTEMVTRGQVETMTRAQELAQDWRRDHPDDTVEVWRFHQGWHRWEAYEPADTGAARFFAEDR